MSKVSRRKFLGSAAVAAGTLLALDAPAFGQKAALGVVSGQDVPADTLSRLGWDAFLPFVNTDFTFRTTSRRRSSFSLRLIDMKDSRPARSRSRTRGQENFILKFGSYRELPSRDAMYSVNHFNLGDFDLFVTNAGRNELDPRQIIYTAVINRITTAERIR